MGRPTFQVIVSCFCTNGRGCIVSQIAINAVLVEIILP